MFAFSSDHRSMIPRFNPNRSCSNRSPRKCGNRTEPLRWVLVRSLQRTASGSGFRSTDPDCRSERSRRKENQSSGIHGTRHAATRNPGTKCPARIRRDSVGPDAAQAIPIYRTNFASGQRGSLQHLQPPQFWKPHQLPEFSSIRAIDDDAGELPGKRRTERWPQSAISDWRTTLDTVGTEASILSNQS